MSSAQEATYTRCGFQASAIHGEHYWRSGQCGAQGKQSKRMSAGSKTAILSTNLHDLFQLGGFHARAEEYNARHVDRRGDDGIRHGMSVAPLHWLGGGTFLLALAGQSTSGCRAASR